MVQDKELVELTLKGERERFGVLVQRYQRAIYRYLTSMGLDHDEAADAMQNAFVKAYDKLHTLRGGEKFRVWLYSIAANQAKNYLRRKAREQPLAELLVGRLHVFEIVLADRPAQDGRAFVH